MNPINAVGYYYTGSSQVLEKRNFTIETIPDNHVVVRVAGCGLCHTDLGFMSSGVKTKHELPLILGHEISGEVVEAGIATQSWSGKSVIVPAVLPCGECVLCRSGRDNICQKQKMPGNDFHGGFASHISVPAKFLCALPDSLSGYRLSELSVIADAVTTPYQSKVRSGLRAGDLAIVIGVGGVGIYMVQHTKVTGAKVVAIDIDDAKLEAAKAQGADYVLNSRALSEKDIKEQIKKWVKQDSLPAYQWKIFETSGSIAGQTAAFSLLNFAGVLSIVGFTMEKLSLRLSNLMAFDAEVVGNWGCRPAYYSDVVKLVLNGRINVRDNIREYPLDSINEIISLAMQHKLDRRAIFVPQVP
jgi:6-hydroxycyclohex-1-ene-1-carbonyl-CoA dehydrogenase